MFYGLVLNGKNRYTRNMGKYAAYKHSWYEEQKKKKQLKCIDCGRHKGLKGVRCGSCQAKIRSKLLPPPDRTGKQQHLIGENNPRWLGNDVGYSALHSWINRQLTKSGICKKCFRKRRTQWANKSHEYKRELSDWEELCSSCHRLYDLGKINL